MRTLSWSATEATVHSRASSSAPRLPRWLTTHHARYWSPAIRVFIGSCTNSRIEDLRSAASIVAGKSVAAGVHAMVVPGSQPIKQQAEREGDNALRLGGVALGLERSQNWHVCVPLICVDPLHGDTTPLLTRVTGRFESPGAGRGRPPAATVGTPLLAGALARA